MRNNKGFSLVELIVVIAIMAILAAVAVVGFSLYIPKAQQANDKQLVSDISYALNLYYQGNPTEMTGGYVIIGAEGTTAGGSAIEALKAMYGEDLSGLKLAYDGWESDGMLSAILAGDAKVVANSTFFDKASTTEMMETVTFLTNTAAGALTSAGKNADTVITMLNLSSEDEADFRAQLEGVAEGTEEYNTIMSNLMVTYIAEELGNTDFEDENAPAPSTGASLAVTYASMYAFSLTNPAAKDEMEEVNRKLGEATNSAELMEALKFSEEFEEQYYIYKTENEDKYINDSLAFVEVMGAVDSVSGSLTDYSNPDMYKSQMVADMLTTYTDGIGAVSGLSNDDLNAIKTNYQDGNIVILISDLGVVTVFPMNVEG